jgi:hypothetical protein
MRNTSVQKFYTENINRYFGITCRGEISEFDSVLENPSVSLKWKDVHQSYLSSSEALVLGIKILGEDKDKSHNAHDMFDHALNSDDQKVETEQLIQLAMGIFYFKKALSEVETDKQIKILKLSEHFINEAILLDLNCSISRLHLVLVKVALQDFDLAVKELVKVAKRSEESKIYEILFKIYESMDLPNVALYYSLKASKGKKAAIV